LEPLSVTDEFLSVLSNNNKICPHFHLSLQSGCDKTLKAMNRRYNTEQYRQVVHKIRQIWPLAGITTDIIVGFPGETEADFQTSLEFCAEMELSRVHVFRFSPREGTRAADMSGQVSPAESAERSRKMQGLADQMSLAFNKKIFNSKLPFFVLLEKLRDDDRLMTGYTDSYAPVLVAGIDAKSSNKLIQVKFTGFDEHFLRGLPVKAD
jgi:threonylcarbamoyladenosine tRNA methylthiotransferase MtaB